MPGISAIIIARNEERNIRDCLRSVAWADQRIVVDHQSIDHTAKIAREENAEVYEKSWEGYSAGKNFALSKAAHEWILWIDADERVTSELQSEILNAVTMSDASVAAYSMPRKSFFLGKWIRHCGWYPGRVIRLFMKEKATFSEHLVHEQIFVQGNIGRLESDLLHYTDDSLKHYFEKFNSYTTLAAEELKEKGRKPTLSDIFIRPPWTFFRMYLFRRGFLDGMHGFVLCVLSALYVFVKYVKLWEYQGATHE